MGEFVVRSAIDRNSAIPLYKQIKSILIEELQAVTGQDDRPFSTEKELERRFHVSRAPIRQALKELTNEGYVYRERAKGTFSVQQIPVKPPGLELGGLAGFFKDQGLDCQSEIVGLENLNPAQYKQVELQIRQHEQLLKVSRLIHVKGSPLALTQTVLALPNAFQTSKQQLEKVDSIFVLLEKHYGIVISRGNHQIFASAATEEEAKLLNIEAGSPILTMETKLYLKNNRLIGWRKAVHRADDYKLSYTAHR